LDILLLFIRSEASKKNPEFLNYYYMFYKSVEMTIYLQFLLFSLCVVLSFKAVECFPLDFSIWAGILTLTAVQGNGRNMGLELESQPLATDWFPMGFLCPSAEIISPVSDGAGLGKLSFSSL
jgi:hypothetical protein